MLFAGYAATCLCRGHCRRMAPFAFGIRVPSRVDIVAPHGIAEALGTRELSPMTQEVVLLVHGYGAHWVMLEPLRRALQRQGFRALSWRYGSLRGSIETHAARLAAKAKELDQDSGIERLHFVGHSMGAIVVRSALAMAQPKKLGRVVLLAPPNRGARLADLALRLFGRRLVAATELCSDPDSYVNRLTPVSDLDCGIIAASWDHVVSPASTCLAGQRDHIVLRSLHMVPLHRHAPAQVGHFLRQGRFLREPADFPLAGMNRRPLT
ncbi:MAG TPA: alpha/beta fold hydrolase [Xanthobacteraceae bacterium]